jgi:predicted RNA methylase
MFHPFSTAGALRYKFFPNRAPILRTNENVSERMVEIDFGRNRISLHVPAIAGVAVMIDETFTKQVYKQLNVNGKKVLDLGAAIGDTAIYFSLRGANTVYAYESDKQLCRFAKENLRLNKIRNAKIVSEAASSKTIDEFAERFEDQPKAIKVDCEGAEYQMILNAKRLEEYGEMILEYHYGYLNLEAKLRKEGFKVSVSRPRLGFNEKGQLACAGLIYATRG